MTTPSINPRDVFKLHPDEIPRYLSNLAATSNYSIHSPQTLQKIKLALYSFALDPTQSTSQLFLPPDYLRHNEQPFLTSDDWNLTTIQSTSTSSNSSSSSLLTSEYSPNRRGKPCGHVFRPGESVYRCRTCGIDSTCVLCSKCFHGSSHVRLGHDVTMSSHSGVGAGCCDCGDVEAWKEGKQKDCRYHGVENIEGGTGGVVGGKGKEKATQQDQVNEANVLRAKFTVQELVRSLMDWALEVFEESPEDIVSPKKLEDITGSSTSTTTASSTSTSSNSRRPPLTDAVSDDRTTEEITEQEILRSEFEAVIRRAAERFPPRLSEETGELEPVVDVEARLEEIGRLFPDTVPSAPRLQSASTPLDTASTQPTASSSSTTTKNKPISPPYAVTLWNDEKHSFAQVIDVVSRSIGCSRQAAGQVAQRVDIHGRDTILVTSNAREALQVSKTINAIELAVTVRSAQSNFDETVAGEVVKWMGDLMKVRVGDESEGLGEIVAKVWLEREAEGDEEEDERGERRKKKESRFMRLAKVEHRLWKEVRKTIQEICVGLTSVGTIVKTELSIQYASIYPQLANAYLLTDREPENSLIFFGVQVFTVPSVCTTLVSEHDFLSTLLSILYAFFTEQVDPPRPPVGVSSSRSPHLKPRRVVLPPNPAIRTIDPESPAFKQKRYFQLFSDLNHLISSPSVQRLLSSPPLYLRLLAQLIDFLNLFTDMNPNVRAVGSHVEYESDAWVSAFNVTIQLGKLCRAFGEAYQHESTSPLCLANGLNSVLDILRLPPPNPLTSDPENLLHSISYNGDRFHDIIKFDVASEKVSFHHPLTWLWSEMAKNVGKLDRKELESVGIKDGFKEIKGRGTELDFLIAMEQPLRAIVLVAQIRVGLWVRNGFGVRAQQLHYKEYSLRENTYDQDVFFLQNSLVMLDPSHILATIVDRFDLRSWLILGRDEHASFESNQAMSMTEELLTLLITLVSDPTYTQPLDHSQALKRELVHHLALGPSVYSDLLRRVSERFGDDPTMDEILAQIAHFKPPTGTNDQGTYSLREDHFDQVDPYFSRYTRNQREEVDGIVREHLKKKNNASSSSVEPVIVPRPLVIERGQFVDLSKTLTSPVLHSIVYHSLRHGRSRGELFSEVVVDQALQIAMLALVDPTSSRSFIESATKDAPIEAEDDKDADEEDREADEYVPSRNKVEDDESTLVRLLVKIEEDERMKAVQPKASWILDRLEESLGDEVKQWRKRSMVSQEDELKRKNEEKRLAAKKRQEAIMQQFAKAQSAFLESVEDDEDDEDEDEMDEDDQDRMDEGREQERKAKLDFGSCIVCQDELEPSKAFGLLGLVQGSTLIRLTPTGPDNYDFQREILSMPPSLDVDASPTRPYGIALEKTPVHSFDDTGDGLARGFPQNQKSGFHVSSCGHMMHLNCFETYCGSLAARHRQQPTRCHPETIERREFVCPLCKSLGNVLLPIDSDALIFDQGEPHHDPQSLCDWMNTLRRDATMEDLRQADRLQLLNDLDNSNALKPLRISLALPTLALSRFSEREGIMIGRLLQVLTALKGEIGGPNPTLATFPKDVLGYTISSIEIGSRGSADPVHKIGDANLRLLQSLFATSDDLTGLALTDNATHTVEQLAVTQRLGGVFSEGTKFGSIEFTQLDPLGSVIEAAAITPLVFYHVTTIAFYTFLGQSLIGVYRLFHQSSRVAEWLGDKTSSEASEYSDLAAVKRFFPSHAFFDPSTLGFRLTLGKHLHAQVLPFLRRAAIVARVVFGEPASPSPSTEASSEYSRLLDLLHIPPPGIALSPTSVDPSHQLIQQHLRLCASSATYLNGRDIIGVVDKLINSSAPEIEHPVIYELLGLPHQLDTMIASALERKCPRCDTTPENPALCLLCGELVCCQSFCCMAGEEEAQHGEANEHMWTCGGSIGIYFLIKRNTILCLHTDKGAFILPPYLDSHGEVDTGGRRTRSQFPQYLHRGRYDELRKVWLQQTVPTLVARKLEATTDHGGWTTM